MPVALLALAAAVAPPVAPVPPEKTFGTWTLACDNLRNCGAVSLHETMGPTEEGAWVLHLTRRGSADAPVQVEALPAFGEDSPGAVSVRIDGKKSPFGFNDNGEATGGSAALLAAIANALDVKLVNAKGKDIGFIPTGGASAALRYIDDRQGRAGTVTALVAKGTKPVSAIPVGPAVPRIAVPPAPKAPPKKLGNADIARIRKTSEFCDGEISSDWETGYYRLDAAHTVALVPCGMGAYQSNALVVIVDEKGNWTPATIETYRKPYPDEKPFDRYILTEADFDPDNRLLLTMARGRGINDCGMGASWAWDGKMFRLASYDALDACAGAPPGTWLPRWHSANDPLADQ